MNKEKELIERKAVGDKAYYKKKLEDDRMTLKILRVLAIMVGIFSIIIIALSIAVKQYNFTIGWSVALVVLYIIGYIWWNRIAKRRDIYLEAYNKNEITKITDKNKNTNKNKKNK